MTDINSRLADHETMIAAIDRRLLAVTERLDTLTQLHLRLATVTSEMAVQQIKQTTAIDGLTAAVHALIDHVSGQS